MTLIIDANRTGDFSEPRTAHADEILRRVYLRRIRICLGGKLSKELSKTKLSKLVMEWSRAGFIERFSDDIVDSKAASLVGLIESDDEHVVALACISGCRLVYTNDEALIKDLKNPALVSPKGKVIKASTAVKYAHPLFDRYGK